MKKLILLIFLPLSVLAQKLPDLGESKVRINEADKTIVAEIEVTSNDIKPNSERLYYWYGSNLIHTTQGGYNGHLLNGLYTEYYLNKNLKEQGSFKHGLKNGAWSTWNEGGKLIQQLTWKKGILSGKYTNYDDLGNLKQSGQYKNGIMNGKTDIYLSKDSVQHLRYKDGKIQGNKPSLLQRLHWGKKKTNRVSAPIQAQPKKPKKKDRKAQTPN